MTTEKAIVVKKSSNNTNCNDTREMITIKRPAEIPESVRFDTVSEDSVRAARFSSDWSLENATNLTPVAAGKIAEALSENSHLNALSISGCSVDARTLKEIFRGLEDGWNARGQTRFNYTLRRLDISGNFLKRGEYIETSPHGRHIFKVSNEAINTLRNILSRAVHLRVLVLRKNQITFEDVGHL